MVSKYQSEKEREFPEQGTCIVLRDSDVMLIAAMGPETYKPVICTFFEWFVGKEPTIKLNTQQEACLKALQTKQREQAEWYRQKCERYRANARRRYAKEKANAEAAK